MDALIHTLIVLGMQSKHFLVLFVSVPSPCISRHLSRHGEHDRSNLGLQVREKSLCNEVDGREAPRATFQK